MTSDNKAHAGYLLFPKVHELVYPQCVWLEEYIVFEMIKKKQWKKNNKPKFEKVLFFFSGQQNKIWACGFLWFTGPVGLWSAKFFVKTGCPCKQSRVTYLLPYTYIRNPIWIETTVWLFLLYICHTVIHRKLQNVAYMKKKSMLKKGGMGNQRHHRVLSTSTCVWYLQTFLTVGISLEMQC